jgi:DtxR family Mn-dependent transcriptional regulator
LNNLSKTEEDYIKALVHSTFLSDKKEVGTNEVASILDVKPATVSDMLKKLKEKRLVNYEKYGKISLSTKGKKLAMEVIRKHRLWETFLFEKLNFSWDEVHEVAEQLEHIRSQKLIDGIDELLDFPKFDPHGDAIPSKDGEITIPFSRLLSDLEESAVCKIIAVKDNSTSFLQYADKIGIQIGQQIKITAIEEFDQLLAIEIDGKIKTISRKFASNVFVLIKEDKGFMLDRG